MERRATIIIEGEAIENPDSVKTWLPRSVALAIVRKGEEMVGVGAALVGRLTHSDFGTGAVVETAAAIHRNVWGRRRYRRRLRVVGVPHHSDAEPKGRPKSPP